MHVLRELAAAGTRDRAMLTDLKPIVIELADRLQYRTNVLGEAATTLHQGYNQFLENLDRIQQGADAQPSGRGAQESERQEVGQLRHGLTGLGFRV